MNFTKNWTLELGPEQERFLEDVARVGRDVPTDSGLGPLWEPSFVLAVSLDVGLKVLAVRLAALGIQIDLPNV